MSRQRSNKEQPGWLKSLTALVGLFLIPPLLTFVIWAIGLLFAWLGGAGSAHIWSQDVWQGFIIREFFPDGWNILRATGMFWMFFVAWMVVWAIVSLAMALPDSSDDYSRRKVDATTSDGVLIVFAFLAVVLTLGGSINFFRAVTGNDKDLGAYYNQYVQFAVEDPNNVPSQLSKLRDDSGTHRTDGDCKYLRTGDVPACITVGKLPQHWVARTASAEAAINKLKKASTGGSNTYVMDDSLTYLYVNGGMWYAVRDGNSRQDLDAVVGWDGKGSTTECRFTGDYAIKGSFNGSWSHNLPSTLAEQFPNLFYDIKDVWGYCNGNEPIVVLPVTRQIAYMSRTVMTNAGVLIIRGDHGRANIYQIKDPKSGTNLNAGELPGPSYPITLTEQARDLSSWAAGRVNQSGAKFGFEPTTATSQFGNVSEYLLENADTGELSWVTPLTPNGSDSQQFVAWAITPAGSGHDGVLNVTTIYVLPDNDQRIINLADLEARTKQALSVANPGFFSAGGKIVEFLPVDSSTWQAYGELNNRVDYRLDIPTNSQVSPSVVSLDTQQPVSQPPTTTPSGNVCSQKPETLTTQQIQACVDQGIAQIQQYLAELAKRAGTSPSAPTSTASPK